MIAVKRDADAHHVVLQLREIERCRGIRGVHDRMVAAGMNPLDEGVEPLCLQMRERRIGFGLCKVREHAVHRNVRTGVERVQKLVEHGVVRDADAVHAGVELDMHVRGLAGGDGAALEAVDLLCGKDGGGQFVADDGGNVIGIGYAQNQDRQGDAVIAKAYALLGDRDGEHVDETGLLQIFADHGDAVTVGVCLDDCQKLGFGFQFALGKPDVFQKCGQMNDRMCTAKHG